MRRFVQPRNQRVFNRLVGLLHHRVSDSLEFNAGFPLRIPGSGSKTVADPQKQLHVLNGAFQIPFWLRDVSDLVVVVRNVFIDEPIAITRWLADVINAIADVEHRDTNLRKLVLISTVEVAQLGPRVGPHDSLLRRGCLYDQVIHRRLARADERDVSRAAPRVDAVDVDVRKRAAQRVYRVLRIVTRAKPASFLGGLRNEDHGSLGRHRRGFKTLREREQRGDPGSIVRGSVINLIVFASWQRSIPTEVVPVSRVDNVLIA